MDVTVLELAVEELFVGFGFVQAAAFLLRFFDGFLVLFPLFHLKTDSVSFLFVSLFFLLVSRLF